MFGSNSIGVYPKPISQSLHTYTELYTDALECRSPKHGGHRHFQVWRQWRLMCFGNMCGFMCIMRSSITIWYDMIWIVQRATHLNTRKPAVIMDLGQTECVNLQRWPWASAAVSYGHNPFIRKKSRAVGSKDRQRTNVRMDGRTDDMLTALLRAKFH